MTIPNIPPTVFPDLPHDDRIIDENGRITPVWRFFFDQLVLALQTNFKNEGLVIPQQTSANIALLTAVASVANILYDSNSKAFKGNVDGTWKTFTVT